MWAFMRVLAFLWRAEPVTLRYRENEKQIVLVRTFKNRFLHTFLSIPILIFSLLTIGITRNFFSLLFALPGIWASVNIMSLWTYKISIDKYAKTIYIRSHLINKIYPLGRSFCFILVDDIDYGGKALYENKVLFFLQYHSECYQKVLDYFKKAGVRIEKN